jgi:SAM-dependent methyltransferase
LNAMAPTKQAGAKNMPVNWPEWNCPVHGVPLDAKDRELACREGHSYPIRDNIPRLVQDSSYAGSFGEQWKRYRTIQLDSRSKTTITRERARRCLGEELWQSLTGRHVLECGCGAGRFTEILLERGALVTSIDLSEAVDANLKNFPQNDRHRIAQADICSLPFPEASYDVVFCLGVLQHTPDPEKSITALARQVKPGGWLVIDHYRYSLSWFTKTAPLFRWYMLRLPVEKRLSRTERIVDFFLPLHRRVRGKAALQALLSRISPVICYYGTFPDLSEDMHRQWSLLDTHDSLTDAFKHFRTKKQIRNTLKILSLQDIRCEHGGTGVEARARRPEAPQSGC